VLDAYKEPCKPGAEKTLLGTLPPNDLLNTYVWLGRRYHLPETDLESRSIEIRLIENTGDMKQATRLYRRFTLAVGCHALELDRYAIKGLAFYETECV
jgi:hypothetical protein